MTAAYAEQEDAALISLLRMGDEAAFEQLFRRYYRELRIYAARLDPTDGSAEEIVQDVFFRIWLNRERLPHMQSLAGYLHVAVRNSALNRHAQARHARRWRGAKLLAMQDRPTAAPAADEEVQSAELARAIERAIAKLPPRCRQAFLLRRQQQMRSTEIAHVMQISPKTVDIHIGLALKALRKALADWI
ncbi:MAG: RNA polymerase sigma-70 factor [Gemmatimonadaceae bacterium]|nr:RNA polymerase sigma-70 factor [Gemmatimonadaceae bacterium]